MKKKNLFLIILILLIINKINTSSDNSFCLIKFYELDKDFKKKNYTYDKYILSLNNDIDIVNSKTYNSIIEKLKELKENGEKKKIKLSDSTEMEINFLEFCCKILDENIVTKNPDKFLEKYFEIYKSVNYFDLNSEEKNFYNKLNLKTNNINSIFSEKTIQKQIERLKSYSVRSANDESKELKIKIEDLNENIIKNLNNIATIYSILSEIFENPLLIDQTTGEFQDNVIKIFEYLLSSQKLNNNIKMYADIFNFINSKQNTNISKFKDKIGKDFLNINKNLIIKSSRNDNIPFKHICIRNNSFLDTSEKKNDLNTNIEKFINYISEENTESLINNLNFIRIIFQDKDSIDNHSGSLFNEKVKLIDKLIEKNQIVLSNYNMDELNKIKKKILSSKNNQNISPSFILNVKNLEFLDSLLGINNENENNNDESNLNSFDINERFNLITSNKKVKDLYLTMQKVFYNKNTNNKIFTCKKSGNAKENDFIIDTNTEYKFEPYLLNFFERLKKFEEDEPEKNKLYLSMFNFLKNTGKLDKIVLFFNSFKISEITKNLELRESNPNIFSDPEFSFLDNENELNSIIEIFNVLDISNKNKKIINVESIYSEKYKYVNNDNNDLLKEDEKIDKENDKIIGIKASDTLDKKLSKNNLEKLFKWYILIYKRDPSKIKNKDSNIGTVVGVGAAAAAGYGIYKNWDKIKKFFGFGPKKSNQPTSEFNLENNYSQKAVPINKNVSRFNSNREFKERELDNNDIRIDDLNAKSVKKLPAKATPKKKPKQSIKSNSSTKSKKAQKAPIKKTSKTPIKNSNNKPPKAKIEENNISQKINYDDDYYEDNHLENNKLYESGPDQNINSGLNFDD